MFQINPISAVDSYKLSHREAYPANTTEVYSNFTPRSVKHLKVPEQFKKNEIVWVGGQAIISDMVEMWNEHFFSVARWRDYVNYIELDNHLNKFVKLVTPFAGADYALDHLRELHALGHLPLEIKTLQEGSRVPVGVPVLTIRNTNPRFFWLTNYIETWLSAELWKPSTSATVAGYYRAIGDFWYEKTGANKAFLDFAFHDFSFRGMGCAYDAAKSGLGHLTFFKGSDTIPAVEYIDYHYSGQQTFVGASVPAMEHSIQTAYTNDYDYFENIITNAYPTGIVSIVADGRNYWEVLTNVLPRLKPQILAREPDASGMPGKVVIRPDSGDPVRIIAGYKYGVYRSVDDARQDEHGISDAGYEIIMTAHGLTYKVNWIEEDTFNGVVYHMELNEISLTIDELEGSISILWDLFGGTTNDKGYKTLDSHIGLIYGDSITLERAEEILSRLEAKGFAADNIVFGVGSYTYQFNTRDTLGFAMKATHAVINGVDTPLWKDPVTDTDKTKKSAKGFLSVTEFVEYDEDDNPMYQYKLINDVPRGLEQNEFNALTTLFKDGQFLKHETFADIRKRALEKTA
jgi:nicotinamide phosphoribosyltransferase